MRATSLTDYRLVGRSGLRVSPLALGTMTFGESWGTNEADSRRIFDTYIDAGGNFIDTANMYSRGAAETLLGSFMEEKRQRLVLASKYSLRMDPTDPNSGGNHRKNMILSVEESLIRLKTDYLDLFYLHVWEQRTPIDEVLRAFDDLVRAGKILYVGISDTPAWQISRMQMLAELKGWSPFVALQIEYSLIQRTVERDLIPMALELGLGVLPWSPLGGGILSAKYIDQAPIEGRGKSLFSSGKANDHSLHVARATKSVADRLGVSASQVALAWSVNRPGVTSPIIGARTPAQFEENLGALSVDLPSEMLAELDAVSAVPLGFPHDFLAGQNIRQKLDGDLRIQRR